MSNLKYLKTPMANFRFNSDKPMRGSNRPASLTLDVMNGNFRIKVDNGIPRAEGEKYKPWMELKLGGYPWLTFIGALMEVADPNSDVKRIPINVMDVPRDETGKPIRPEQGPAQKSLQATLWVGKDKEDIYFMAVQEAGSDEAVKFKLLPNTFFDIVPSDTITQPMISKIVMNGMINYLPSISSLCSVVSHPDNPGVGTGGVGGSGNDGGGQPRPQYNNNNGYQKKPWQGGQGGYQKKPWQGGQGGQQGGYQKKPYNGGQGGGYNNNQGQQGGGGYSNPTPAANVNDIQF